MNIWERKLKKEFVTFSESPAEKDEVEIALLLKEFYAGINSRNLARLLAVFAKDARVELLYLNKIVDVAEYGRALGRILPVIEFSFLDQIRIERSDKESASVYGMLSSRLIGSPKLYRGDFLAECRKINHKWHITATRHFPGNQNLRNDKKPHSL